MIELDDEVRDEMIDMEPNEDMLLDEPIELEHENHEPPEDQTVLSDGDLLDKLADRIALHQDTQIDLTEDLQVIGNPRLALRRCLARL
jgi:hypothetical protein